MQMPPVGASVYLVRSMLLTESEAAAYETKARLAGDRVLEVSVAGANHCDVVEPGRADDWPVPAALQAAVNRAPGRRWRGRAREERQGRAVGKQVSAAVAL